MDNIIIKNWDDIPDPKAQAWAVVKEYCSELRALNKDYEMAVKVGVTGLQNALGRKCVILSGEIEDFIAEHKEELFRVDDNEDYDG